MHIDVRNSQKKVRIIIRSVIEVTHAVLKKMNVACDELAVHFVSEKKICQLHQQFFQDPSPTDCITFPFDREHPGGYFFLGEVFICPETALKYATSQGSSVSQELTLYLIHGLLHLLGYDDMKEADCQVMRRMEKELMSYLSEIHLSILT